MAPNADGTPLPGETTPPTVDPAAPNLPAVGSNTADTAAPTEAGLNFDVLNHAGADPSVWGAELARFLADLTGKHVDEGSLTTLFGAYGSQVQSHTYQQAALAVANAPIAPVGQPKTVLIAQMDLRGDLAELLLGTVA